MMAVGQHSIIPAKAGIQSVDASLTVSWAPAFAGARA
jgi:hypothetical protein